MKINIKKLLIITILVITSFYSKGQSVGIAMDYTPSEVFDIEDFRVEANCFIGSENLQIGGLIKVNDALEEFIFGLESRTKVMTLVESISLDITTGAGVELDTQDETKFSDSHHTYYISYGLLLSYRIDDNISVNQYLKQHYFGQANVFIGGFGASYKLR